MTRTADEKTGFNLELEFLNPAASREKLAEDAAQTTLIVVEFQRW